MQLIELNNCHVQPQAILKIAKGKELLLAHPDGSEVVGDDVDDAEYIWVPVIDVLLVASEKARLRFPNEEERDARYTEIVDELKRA